MSQMTNKTINRETMLTAKVRFASERIKIVESENTVALFNEVSSKPIKTPVSPTTIKVERAVFKDRVVGKTNLIAKVYGKFSAKEQKNLTKAVAKIIKEDKKQFEAIVADTTTKDDFVSL